MILLFYSTVVACASSQSLSGGATHRDPYEASNRKMLSIHLALDRTIIKPLAKAYVKIPQPVRTSLRNVSNNLSTPLTLIHDVLQGEGKRGGISLARFLINSTLGLFGLFDPASTLGLMPHSEDLGQTLARWGVAEGPYLFIPVFGPRSSLDFSGWVFDFVIDPKNYSDVSSEKRLFLSLLNGISFRADSLDYLDDIERTSVDFYATLRNFYWQNRATDINNGFDIESLPDIEDFEDE